MDESVLNRLKDVRARIEAVTDEQYRIALMYQYLVGGEAGEVSGINAPLGSDLILTSKNIRGKVIRIVYFLVKTVRKDDFYRVSAVPYDSEYEPWIVPVVEWFNKFKNTNPFRFSDKASLESNKKYLMDKASDVFSGLKWFKDSYTIEGRRQERRWINFTSSQLRDLRHEVLKGLYGFNEVDLAYYGSWNDPPINAQVKLSIEQILTTKIDKNDIEEITKVGNSYIEKLLIKYPNLGDIDSRRFFDPLSTEHRFERTKSITNLIQYINLVSNIKFNTDVFNEDMGFVLDAFTQCNDETRLKSNVTNVMCLFEINLDRFKELVNYDGDEKLITLFYKLLKENDIKEETYKKMISTWRNINELRNYFNHPRDADKLKIVLNYFEEPLEIPIDTNSLWNKILVEYENSLYDCLNILNDINVNYPVDQKIKVELYCDKELMKTIYQKISTRKYRFADASHFFENLCNKWLEEERDNA